MRPSPRVTVGDLLEGRDWRANADWGRKLGFDEPALPRRIAWRSSCS